MRRVQKKTKKIIIIQAAYDGCSSHHCGVGSFVLNTLQVINNINKDSDKKLDITTHLITPNYRHLSCFSNGIFETNRSFCQKTGGTIIEVCTKRNIFHNEFGEIENWKQATKEALEICSKIAFDNKEGNILVMAHDTAFAQLPLLLSTRNLHNVKSVYIPHCTTAIYDLFSEDKKRKNWESEAFISAKKTNCFIGWIGNFIKENTKTHYKYIKNINEVSLKIGIPHNSIYFKKASDYEIKSILKKFNIPIDKKLLFAVGRFTPIKGIDTVVRVFAELYDIYKNKDELYLVMLCPNGGDKFVNTSYSKNIKEYYQKLNLPVSIIETFENELPKYIYQWKNTYAVLILSRAESMSFIPIEARACSNNCIVIANSVGGLKEQIRNFQDGILCRCYSKDSPSLSDYSTPTMKKIAKKIKCILNFSKEKRSSLVLNGKLKVIKCNNYDNNFLQFLAKIYQL